MIKIVSKEESQVIDLYRKIKSAYARYHSAEYIRINASNSTGEQEKIPDALDDCDSIWEAYNAIGKDMKNLGYDEQQIKETEEKMKEEMQKAYYGR